MSRIVLQPAVKAELVRSIQQYFSAELQQEIGGFDAEFLLEFFAEQLGSYFYNQGLADALTTLEAKMEELADSVYQLEKESPSIKNSRADLRATQK